MRPADFQVVRQKTDRFDDHVGPYGGEQVGIRILDRVFWFTSRSSHGGVSDEEFKRWEYLANLVVGAAQAHVRENLRDMRQLRDGE